MYARPEKNLLDLLGEAKVESILQREKGCIPLFFFKPEFTIQVLTLDFIVFGDLNLTRYKIFDVSPHIFWKPC